MDAEPGEEIFFHGHAAYRAMLAPLARGVLVSLLAGVAAGFASAIADGSVRTVWVVLAVVVTFAVALLVVALLRVRTTYSITNRRLTIEKGLLSRELHQTRLERIQNVNSRQSLLQRVLRVGTLDFDTAGEAEFDFAFRGVADPRRLVQTVDRALHELRGHDPAPQVDL